MTVSPVVATDAPSTDATRTTATSATSPAVATDAGGVSISAFDGSRVRVVLMLDVHDGMQQEFLDAYERIRDRVAAVPGHVSDQLCQSLENPTQWLLTSEWESAAPFLAWVNSDEHLDTVEPLATCVRDTHSLRYSVLRETDGGRPAPGEPRSAPRIGDNVVRHALTFTVRPGTEAETARLLSEYVSPDAHVDGSTRLLRTSLFMSGNRIVRAVEVRGDLQTALRHVARQPGVRAVEEALNPYLEQDRDLGDPQSARRFFTRAAMPAVHHATYPDRSGARRERLALLYPVPTAPVRTWPGCWPVRTRPPPGTRTARCWRPPSSTATTSSYGSSTWTATPRTRPPRSSACTAGAPRMPSGCWTPPPSASTGRRPRRRRCPGCCAGSV